MLENITTGEAEDRMARALQAKHERQRRQAERAREAQAKADRARERAAAAEAAARAAAAATFQERENHFGSGLIEVEPIDRERTLEGFRTLDTGELPAEAREQAWAMLRLGMIEGVIAACFGISIQALRRELIAGRPKLAEVYWAAHVEAMRINTAAHAEMIQTEFGGIS